MRRYIFELEDGKDGRPETITFRVNNNNQRATVEDFRFIISECCTLILQFADAPHPELIKRVLRIQEETGLVHRTN